MLSKEEIEKALKSMRIFARVHQDMSIVTAKEMEIVLQYIEQLESDKQKLIEWLEEEIKEEREIMKPLEHKSMAFHYANGRETLAQDILKILKGEKE